MSNSKLIETKRKEFAVKYQRLGTPEDLAVLAAVQHGYLYSPNLSNGEKLRIKNEWKRLLKEIGSKYQLQRTIEDFINDIQNLKRRMNEQFPDSFNNENIEYENGFRIAHAQKSLSIYLKHCWCRKAIAPIPPACPIDGNVLKWVHVKQAWTKCNSVEDVGRVLHTGYRSQYNTIRMFVGHRNPGLSVFEWELFNWKSDSEKKNSPHKKTEKEKKSSIEGNARTSIISNKELKLLQKRYPNCVISGNKFKIKDGPYVDLRAEFKNETILAVGQKQTFYFCGIYKKERTDNTYPEVFDKKVKNGYYKRFKTDREALNQFEDILQRKTKNK